MKLGDVRSHGRRRRTDPVIIATILAIAFVILFILACVVPSIMINKAKPVACAPTDWLRRDEQTLCRPSSKNTYVAKVDSGAASLMKYYRVLKSEMPNTKTRSHLWVGSADLSQGAFVFPVTCSFGMKLSMKATCTEGRCDTVRMWWLHKDSFDNANKTGTFDESLYGTQQSDFSDGAHYFTESMDSSSLYYLVFADKSKASKLVYNGTIVYTIYDTSKAQPVTCTNAECSFEDVGNDEAILMEYIDNENKGPEYIAAEIKSAEGSIGGAVFVCILFLLFALACLVFLVLFALQAAGKINLYSKRPLSGGDSGSDQGSYEAPEKAAAVVVEVSGGASDEL